MTQLTEIIVFVFNSFLRLWPYLLITIPFAVFIQVSGISSYIFKIFNQKPLISILLATFIGAFSPLCSCGVIPVITTLLIGGVPLAPVMAFWIASPSMDPEVLFLSAATVGWRLSLWRLLATFSISLFAGIFVHIGIKKQLIPKDVLLKKHKNESCEGTCGCSYEKPSLKIKIIKESWQAISIVTKFMLLAFFINALIHFYVPENLLGNILNSDNFLNVIFGALVGIPFYTSNITAIPLVSGLLDLGVNQGTVLAFLIAGPVTTLPAMIAVFGIAKKKIFLYYITISFVGAVSFGLLYNILY